MTNKDVGQGSNNIFDPCQSRKAKWMQKSHEKFWFDTNQRLGWYNYESIHINNNFSVIDTTSWKQVFDLMTGRRNRYPRRIISMRVRWPCSWRREQINRGLDIDSEALIKVAVF